MVSKYFKRLITGKKERGKIGEKLKWKFFSNTGLKKKFNDQKINEMT